MTFKRDVFKSGIWLQISNITQLASNFIVTIVLARLLEPNIFGLIGIVTIYSGFLAQFTSFGITLAIIQKKDITQSQLSTIFWLNVGFNVFSGLILIISAPFASKLYQQPKLTPLICLISINLFITPLFQVHRRLLEKNLLFKKTALVEIASACGSGIVAILLAFLGYGIYSLIWQSISMTFIYFIGFWMAIRWKPNFIFRFAEVKELFYFSVKMKLARLGNYFERNIDYLILSKIFNPILYGYYTLAYRVLYFPVRRLSYVFSDVLFPAFSFIQEKTEKIKNGVLKSISLLSMVLMPITIILGFFSKQIVDLFLGQKWQPIANVLYLFSLAGFFQSLENVSDSVYPALNKPGILIKLELFRTIFTGLAVYLGSFYKIFGVAVALVICRAALFAIAFYYVNRLISIQPSEYIHAFRGPSLAALTMIIFYSFLQLNAKNETVSLFINLSLGAVIYLVSLFVFNKKELRYFFNQIYKKNYRSA